MTVSNLKYMRDRRKAVCSGGFPSNLGYNEAGDLLPTEFMMTIKSLITSRTACVLVFLCLCLLAAGCSSPTQPATDAQKPAEPQKPADAKFVLDMTVPDLKVPPWGVDLYMNNLVDQPGRVPVHGGSRFRYEFPCKYQKVDFLRLDPVQVLGVEVAIHSLTFEVDGVVVHRFSPEELSKWTTGQPGKVENDALKLQGVKNVNHIEKSGLDLRVPVSPH